MDGRDKWILTMKYRGNPRGGILFSLHAQRRRHPLVQIPAYPRKIQGALGYLIAIREHPRNTGANLLAPPVLCEKLLSVTLLNQTATLCLQLRITLRHKIQTLKHKYSNQISENSKPLHLPCQANQQVLWVNV